MTCRRATPSTSRPCGRCGIHSLRGSTCTAIAEEQIFYPRLLEFGEDPDAETLDTISDHNDIRDGDER